MATYYASKILAGKPARAGIGLEANWDMVTLSAALALNDICQLIAVPKGAVVLDLHIGSSDLDSNVSPTLQIDVGDDLDVDRYIDGSTFGQTATFARIGANILNTHTWLAGYAYTADNTVDMLVASAAATAASSGTVYVSCLYSNQD